LESFVLFGKVCKRFYEFSIAFNKLLVEVNIFEEASYFFNVSGYWLMLDGLDFRCLYYDLPGFNGISKVVNFLCMKLAFLGFD